MSWQTVAKEAPKTQPGNYFKFEDGANKFRIMSDPISGYQYWTNDNKPVRLREYPTAIPADMRADSKIKYFWAFAVWNVRDKRVQVLELTQSTIINAITDLINSEDWGDPKGYSLTVTKKGEKLDTEYTVQPSPHAEVPAEVTAQYKRQRIDLNKLYEGGNPFLEDEVDITAVPFD